ncbi:hypothetical protein ILYODFUR_003573 [Ilyodon furcidens]|uniref:Uncharacterized protein n=1 Tax=Ilyodon furcidens TaxID=33524 RepID=A0ABV0T544_9TELE
MVYKQLFGIMQRHAKKAGKCLWHGRQRGQMVDPARRRSPSRMDESSFHQLLLSVRQDLAHSLGVLTNKMLYL